MPQKMFEEDACPATGGCPYVNFCKDPVGHDCVGFPLLFGVLCCVTVVMALLWLLQRRVTRVPCSNSVRAITRLRTLSFMAALPSQST
jgi:hypothetical protein